jgi:hypothetical protein
MGRANSRSRKRKGTSHSQHPQHLAKVGSHTELEHEGRRERAAIMDVMGMGGTSQTTRTVLFWVCAIVLVGGIIGLVILNTV